MNTTDNDKKNGSSPLVQGDANAISELNNTVDSHNTDSHDTNNTNSNNVSADSHDTITHNSDSHDITYVIHGGSVDELSLGERKAKYREFCKQKIKTGITSKQTRIELDQYAAELSLNETDAYAIEDFVKKTIISDTFSSVDQMKLDFAIKQITNNSPNVKEQLPKLEALAETTEQAEVHFYYYLLLAVENPSTYIKKYENRNCDIYWQSYWAYMAYKRNGTDKKAEIVLRDLSNWEESEDNLLLMQSAGFLYDFFVRNASMDNKEMAIHTLQRCNSYSYLLQSFYKAIAYMADYQGKPLLFSNANECNFYLRLFDAKTITASPKKPVQSFAAQQTFATPPPSSPISKSAGETINKGVTQQAETKQTKTVTQAPAQPSSPSTPSSIMKWAKIAGIALAAIFIIKVCFFNSDDKKTETKITTETTIAQEAKQEPPAQAIEKNTNSDKKNNTSVKATKPAATATQTTPKQTTTTASSVASTPVAAQKVTTPAETTTTAAPKPVAVAELSADELLAKGKSATRKFQYEKAIGYFNQAATKGNVQANYYIGEFYYNGNGVNKSYPTAMSYFSKAANAGMADAEYMMGVMYRNGQGCTKDLGQAQKWLEKAAAKGHTKAEQILNRL